MTVSLQQSSADLATGFCHPVELVQKPQKTFCSAHATCSSLLVFPEVWEHVWLNLVKTVAELPGFEILKGGTCPVCFLLVSKIKCRTYEEYLEKMFQTTNQIYIHSSFLEPAYLSFLGTQWHQSASLYTTLQVLVYWWNDACHFIILHHVISWNEFNPRISHPKNQRRVV